MLEYLNALQNFVSHCNRWPYFCLSHLQRYFVSETSMQISNDFFAKSLILHNILDLVSIQGGYDNSTLNETLFRFIGYLNVLDYFEIV